MEIHKEMELQEALVVEELRLVLVVVQLDGLQDSAEVLEEQTLEVVEEVTLKLVLLEVIIMAEMVVMDYRQA